MRIELFEIPVDNLSKEETLSYINALFNENTPHYAVAINPEKIMKAYKDEELLSIIKKSDLNFVDGVGVIFAARHFKRVKIKERITGIDLFTEIIKLAEKESYSVFFLGSKEESIQRAIKNIEMNFPNLKIAGYSNGYLI